MPIKKIVFLHAGMPKTGTTSLQSFFLANRAEIYNHTKIYTPEAGLGLGYGKDMRHIGLFPANEVPDEWVELNEEIAHYPDASLFLTQEGLSTQYDSLLSDDSFKKFRENFSAYTIKIIVYLRRFDDYLKSQYNQNFKEGRVQLNYSDYICKRYKEESPRIFQSKILERFFSLVGRDNVIVRLYDKEHLKNGNIVDDFFAAIQVELPEGLSSGLSANPSLPNEAIPFFSKKILKAPGGSKRRTELIEIANYAFCFSRSMSLPIDSFGRLTEEIERIDSYAPGYKKLFLDRPCSLEFPEIETSSFELLSMFMLNKMHDMIAEQKKILVKQEKAFEELTREVAALKNKESF